jgi:hypothetical protein
MSKVEETIRAIAYYLAAQKYSPGTWDHSDERDRLVAKFKEWQRTYKDFPEDD